MPPSCTPRSGKGGKSYTLDTFYHNEKRMREKEVPGMGPEGDTAALGGQRGEVTHSRPTGGGRPQAPAPAALAHLQPPSCPGVDGGAALCTPPSPSTIPSPGSSSWRKLPHTFHEFLEHETMVGLSPIDSCFLPFKQRGPPYSSPKPPSKQFQFPPTEKGEPGRDLGPSRPEDWL